jgi:hypothetical protein
MQIGDADTFANERLRYAFAEQLKKDFISAGADPAMLDPVPFEYDLLVAWTEDLLVKMRKTPGGIQPLLYRVDISESQLKKNYVAGRKAEHTIAALIIKRILQKVVIRLRFS